MQYMVVGGDGKEYGPVDGATLKQWATEKRVLPTTEVRDVLSAQTMSAGSIAGLFPQEAPPIPEPVPATYSPPPSTYEQNPPPPGTYAPPPGGAWSQPPSAYPRQGYPAANQGSEGNGVLVRSLIYSGLAIVLFFIFKGIGLIMGVYGVIYAFRAHGAGNKRAMIAIVVSIIALVIVGIGWLIRLNGGGV